jgi:tight adherence protein B
MSGGGLPLLLGALAGWFALMAVREMAGGLEAPAIWVKEAVEPLRRAGSEGYLPTSGERMRLGAVAGFAAVMIGWFVAGLTVAAVLAAMAPSVAAMLIARRRRLYRRAIEAAVPEIARAIADCLSAGHSPRGALVAATSSLDGPAAAEFRRLRADLELGTPTGGAVDLMARRLASARIDAFAAAVTSQRVAGGDLAALLRRFAEGAAERDRVAEDARSATAQARFTGYLVVAMPAGAALFTELIRPGFLESLVSSPPALAVLAVSVLMQVAGFVAISRLARVGEV